MSDKQSEFIVIIRPEFMKFCKDACRAATLNHLLFRIAYKCKDQPKEKIQAGKILWYAKTEQITSEMSDAWGVCKVRKEVNELVISGLIGRTKDPNWGVNRTKHFFFGKEQCQKFIELCGENGICVVHLDLPPEVKHLIYSSNAKDTSIKCSCANDKSIGCNQSIHQMQTIDVSDANDISIEAITKKDYKDTNKEGTKEESIAANIDTSTIASSLPFDALSHSQSDAHCFFCQEEAELTCRVCGKGVCYDTHGRRFPLTETNIEDYCLACLDAHNAATTEQIRIASSTTPPEPAPSEAGRDSERLQESEGELHGYNNIDRDHDTGRYGGIDTHHASVEHIQQATGYQDTADSNQGQATSEQVTEGEPTHEPTTYYPHSDTHDTPLSLGIGSASGHDQEEQTLPASERGGLARTRRDMGVDDETILPTLHGASLVDDRLLHPSNGRSQVDSARTADLSDALGVAHAQYGSESRGGTGTESTADRRVGGGLGERGELNGRTNNDIVDLAPSDAQHLPGVPDSRQEGLVVDALSSVWETVDDSEQTPSRGGSAVARPLPELLAVEPGDRGQSIPVAPVQDISLSLPAQVPGHTPASRAVLPPEQAASGQQSAQSANHSVELPLPGAMVNGASVTGIPLSQEAPVSSSSDVQASGQEDVKPKIPVPLVEPDMSGKWSNEKCVQYAEWCNDKRYTDKMREEQLKAAQAIHAKDRDLTLEQFKQAYDERNDEWWLEHKKKLHVSDMKAKGKSGIDRVHEMLQRIEDRATRSKSKANLRIVPKSEAPVPKMPPKMPSDAELRKMVY